MVIFQLDRGLIRKDNIIELLSSVLLSPSQVLHFILVPDELAVGAASEGPSKNCSASEDSAQ